MNKGFAFSGINLILIFLAACRPVLQNGPEIKAEIQSTAIQLVTDVSLATNLPLASATITPETHQQTTFEFSEKGPYQVGVRSYKFTDTSRDDRFIALTVWYPAEIPQDASVSGPFKEAQPDFELAPYPLILSSSKMGKIFAPHLASYGFVLAGVNNMDSSDRWGEWLIDYPLDILFALDQIGSQGLEGLEGMINANRTGVMGYSFDGYDALALSGARIDPEFYQSKCATVKTQESPPADWWIKYICDMNENWDEFAAHAGEAITVSDDGLWQPMTDERIRAVMPLGPEGAWIFGERGLAAVDRPTMIIAGTEDDLNYYDLEAVYIYEHLGTPDRFLISYIDQGHMTLVYSPQQISCLKHFETAFFGYYLQGREDYADYFSETTISQFDDLAWGVYRE
jgi:predicted dienelactone hydrolase